MSKFTERSQLLKAHLGPLNAVKVGDKMAMLHKRGGFDFVTQVAVKRVTKTQVVAEAAGCEYRFWKREAVEYGARDRHHYPHMIRSAVLIPWQDEYAELNAKWREAETTQRARQDKRSRMQHHIRWGNVPDSICEQVLELCKPWIED